MGSLENSATGSAQGNIATSPAGPVYGNTYYINLSSPSTKKSWWLGKDNDNSAILVEKQEQRTRVQELKYDGKIYYKLLDKDYYLSLKQQKALFRPCLAAVGWRLELDEKDYQNFRVDFVGCPPWPGAPPAKYKLAKQFQDDYNIFCVGAETEMVSEQQNYEFLIAKFDSAPPAGSTKAGVDTLPTGATPSRKYSFQLSYQAKNGEKITGWLGHKQDNGKDFAFFVPENEVPENKPLVLELIEYSNQQYYRIPCTPDNEHSQQHLYLSIVAEVADGDKIKSMVGFSGCWAATSWQLGPFTERWWKGKTRQERFDNEQAYQKALRTKKLLTKEEYQKDHPNEEENKYELYVAAYKRLRGDNLVWNFTGKRLSLDKDKDGKPDPSKPLICLCEPTLPPGFRNLDTSIEDPDKLDEGVLTVKLP